MSITTGALTDYGERSYLGIPLGFSYTAPTYYTVLSTTPFNDDGTGGTELTVGGYSRQVITWQELPYPTGLGYTNGAYVYGNNGSIVYGPFASNTGSLYLGISDASTVGNLVFTGGSFVMVGAMTAGQTATIHVGDILTYVFEDPFIAFGVKPFTLAMNRTIMRAFLGIAAYPYTDLWIGQAAVGDTGLDTLIATWGSWSTPATSGGVTTSQNTAQWQWTAATGGHLANFARLYNNNSRSIQVGIIASYSSFAPLNAGDTVTIPAYGSPIGGAITETQ